MSVRGSSARYGTLALLLATPLVLAACSSSGSGSSSSSPSANSPINIGYELPLTGPAALPGKQEQEGWNLGLKAFGSTVDGHHIVTYFDDTGGDPTVALSDARSLVEQKHVQIMEGPLLASEDAAVAPYLGAQHVPTDNLAVCSQTQVIDDAKYGNAFSSGWLCDQPDVMAADYLYKDLGYRHVTVLATDYAFGWLSAGGFIKQFTLLGGKIDKVLWPPLTATDYGPYVSAIPRNTQAVFAETVGAAGPIFTKTYAQFGLRGKIPLYGMTNLFDYSVLPGEVPADVMGDQMAAQYCDGINTPANNKFVSLFNQTYHTRPGYYAEAAYVHAELVVAALKALHGDATNSAAVAHALKTTAVTAPRGPVRLSTVVDAPIQNIYICKVEKVNGTMEDVPIKTYPAVQPWGTLPYKTWTAEFTTDSTGRPGT
ncbi:MAG TPA: ABC transporter substrate-binding protein [Streptosporangiaceae bacterium]|nr:ABC transporter substrate-binding protein [Streptosporangiaceae bacterium]